MNTLLCLLILSNQANMISVTRFRGKSLWINPLLIETVEETPDTIITLTTGKKILVAESAAVISELVQAYIHKIGIAQALTKDVDVEGHDLEK